MNDFWETYYSLENLEKELNDPLSLGSYESGIYGKVRGTVEQQNGRAN